ncbi:MAG: hypoxanthine-guanine phosphoribosyltransferase [Pseudomonadota bacterium]|nr:hypoxanthine-guanine phosphoribosyltransferase [Pseudomonadota bacterium]
MTRLSLTEALQNSDMLHSQLQLDTAIARMAAEVDASFVGVDTPLFITVMNGGLMVGAALALQCKTSFQFDYVHATRYRGATQGSGLEWVARPRTSLQGRDVLIVDDILDEGRTLAPVKQWCLDQGASRVQIAVLCAKQHDRRVPGINAEFVGVSVPDRYVYGFGMDYYELGRNLDAIYALR